MAKFCIFENDSKIDQNYVHKEIKSRLKDVKNVKIQNYNFTCCFVWVWNLVSRTEGRTQIEGVWKQGAKENIWT